MSKLGDGCETRAVIFVSQEVPGGECFPFGNAGILTPPSS